MVKFGPSGNDEKFYADGNKSSLDAPRWLNGIGLDAYEISFGRGIRMTEKTASIIGEQAKKHGVQISVHAPYYINLANLTSFDKNYNYIKRSLELLFLMGGNRLVVHTGSQMDMTREVAIQNCRDSLEKIIKKLDNDGISDFLLCIETMGKYTQIGDVNEICDLCKVDKRIIPTLDFGHINCLEQGNMNIEKIFKSIKIFDKIHIHMSFIEFGAKGEIRHLTLNDTKFGFDVQDILSRVKAGNFEAVVICESANVMAMDSIKLRNFYLLKTSN